MVGEDGVKVFKDEILSKFARVSKYIDNIYTYILTGNFN